MGCRKTCLLKYYEPDYWLRKNSAVGCAEERSASIADDAPPPFSADRNGYHASIPAWVCTQCGEALFEENEVNHIERALQKIGYHLKTGQIFM